MADFGRDRLEFQHRRADGAVAGLPVGDLLAPPDHHLHQIVRGSCLQIGRLSQALRPSRSTVTWSQISRTSSSLWLTKTMRHARHRAACEAGGTGRRSRGWSARLSVHRAAARGPVATAPWRSRPAASGDRQAVDTVMPGSRSSSSAASHFAASAFTVGVVDGRQGALAQPVQHDVLANREARDQVAFLMHHADAAGACGGMWRKLHRLAFHQQLGRYRR